MKNKIISLYILLPTVYYLYWLHCRVIVIMVSSILCRQERIILFSYSKKMALSSATQNTLNTLFNRIHIFNRKAKNGANVH